MCEVRNDGLNNSEHLQGNKEYNLIFFGKQYIQSRVDRHLEKQKATAKAIAG